MLDNDRIIKIEGDLAHVLIKTQDHCKTCGARVLCSPQSDKDRIIIANNSTHASVEDTVVIEEAGSLTLKLSFLQYGIPFLGFLIGIAMMYVLYPNPKFILVEILQFFGGIIGVFIGGLVGRNSIKKIAEKPGEYLKII